MNMQKGVLTHVRSIGQSSFSQSVGSDFRAQYQCRHAEKDRENNVWTDKADTDRSHTKSYSNASYMSDKSIHNGELSTRNCTSSKREHAENLLAPHHEHANQRDDKNRRILNDVTNKSRSRPQGNVSSDLNSGKENNAPGAHSDSRQRHASSTDRVRKNRCSLGDIMQPLSVYRLRPIRQKTRNVVLSILEDETVCLEFIKPKGSEMYVTEVLRISSDGNKITSYDDANGRVGLPLEEKPPPVPDSAVSYAFSGLPQKFWKKYQYADKFIRLVRMKSPKVGRLLWIFRF